MIRLNQIQTGIVRTLMIAGLLILSSQYAYSAGTVSVSLAGDTLAVALPLVGKSAEIPLRCGRNAANRRIFLFTSGASYKEVIEQLKLFIPKKPGKTIYFKDRGVFVFDEDNASFAARKEAARKRLVQARAAREQRLSAISKWLTDDKAIQKDGPGRRRQARHYFSLFNSLPEALKDASLSGKPVSIPYSSLPPAAQTTMRGLLAGRGNYHEGQPQLDFNGSRDYAKTFLTFTPTGTPGKPGISPMIRYPNGGATGMRDLLHADQWNPSEGFVAKEIDPDYHERERGPKDRDKNPDLQGLVSFSASGELAVERALQELSKQSTFPLLGEYDPCYANLYVPHQPEQITLDRPIQREPLWKALDLICKRFDLDWDYRKGWLWIRSPRTVLEWSGELDLSPPP